MTRQAAKAFYDVQAGDPATGYITPADAQAALDVVYDDMATAGAVPRITGSPEGVRVGNPGDEVIQTDASARDVKGWLRWVKATGTGNTGWVAGPEADTGVRTISSLSNGWAASSSIFYLRRQGNRVQLTVYLDPTSASGGTFYTLPSGFRPPFSRTGIGIASASKTALLEVAPAGSLTMIFYDTIQVYYLTASWDTSDAWPTSLPGSAV